MLTQEEILFFDGNGEGLRLYALLKDELLARHPETLFLPAKTQISLKSRFVFGCVSLPRRKGQQGLILTLGLPFRLESPRVQQVSQPYPGRWTHHIFLGGPEEADSEIREWTEAAHRFAREKKPRSASR